MNFFLLENEALNRQKSMNKSENNSTSCFYWFIVFNQNIDPWSIYSGFFTQNSRFTFGECQWKGMDWKIIPKIEYFFAKNDFGTHFAQGWAFLWKSFFLIFLPYIFHFWRLKLRKTYGWVRTLDRFWLFLNPWYIFILLGKLLSGERSCFDKAAQNYWYFWIRRFWVDQTLEK